MSNVIVIGAGAAGLMTAKTLSEKGIGVTVIEARDRPGGRIFTMAANEFSAPVDLGAEFVHGKPPILRSLIKEAGLKVHYGQGRLWHVAENNVTEDDPFDEDWGEFMRKLNRLETDMPIGEFLREQFGDESHASLRESVSRFVQGFDAADPDKASSFSLREEWSDSDDALMGGHIEGGLGSVIYYLQQECLRNKVKFHFSTPVQSIQWTRNSVRVKTSSQEFQAPLCVITIPPAVLKNGGVRFVPAINEHMRAVDKIETGGVIKFLFEFSDTIWDSRSENEIRQFPDMHFIFSDAYVPTWWSQLPSKQPLLTGWLSGPKVKRVTKPESELIMDGLNSLAYIFNTSVDEISARLRSGRVVNWEVDSLSCGAYAYRSVGVDSALKFLSEGIEHTIFFAGEGYSAGKEIGTVEAGLDSGKKVADIILRISSWKE